MPTYLATRAPMNGGYDDAGAEAIEFRSDNAAAAEAYALMHDLRLDGILKSKDAAGAVEKNDPAEDWKTSAPDKGDRVVTKKQKATICQLAAAVFKDLDEMGLIDAPGSSASERSQNWRRAEVQKCTGLDSLTKCRNSHYRKLYDHFSSLTGKQYNNPQMKCTGKQSAGMSDTMESREQAIYLISTALAKHEQVVSSPQTAPEISYSVHAKEKGGALRAGYILAIARNQNKEHALRDFSDIIKLPFARLDNLLYTTRNRIAAREGRGNTRSRNKSQSKKK